MQELQEVHQERLMEQEQEWTKRCEDETERLRLQRIEVFVLVGTRVLFRCTM